MDVADVLKKIESCNDEGRTKTFAEFIVSVCMDKFVEIYVGDEYESVNTEQVSTTYPAIFCGKVVAAYKECLVLNSAYEKDRTLKLGNLVFINERAIRAISELDGNGILQDLFIKSSEALKIAAQIKDQ